MSNLTARQQKIIVISACIVLGVVALYAVVNAALISPSAGLTTEAGNLRKEIADLQKYNSLKGTYEKALKDTTRRMLGSDEASANYVLSSMIPSLADESHLTGKLLPWTPLGATSVGGYYREVGQAVKIHGRIEDLTDFIYLLEAQPFIHRVDNLKLSRSNATGEFDLSLNYRALIVDPAKLKLASQPTTTSAPAPVENLDTEQRRLYNVIASRDMWRPYVKKYVAAPTPSPRPRDPEPTPRPPQPPPPMDYRICGLVTWEGEQYIWAKQSNDQTLWRKPGDSLGKCEIVMIDNRSIDRPDKPILESSGRIIVKSEGKYFAAEIGQNLSSKRPLAQDQLPDELKQPSSAPAETKASTEATGANHERIH